MPPTPAPSILAGLKLDLRPHAPFASLVFPTATFDALIESSPVFQDFCTRRLSHLLDLSRSRLQAEYAAILTEERGLSTPLADLLRQAPVTCGRTRRSPKH